MSTLDDSIRKYADKLQNIYDMQIAGDFTFDGVLAEFTAEILKNYVPADNLYRPLPAVKVAETLCAICGYPESKHSSGVAFVPSIR